MRDIDDYDVNDDTHTHTHTHSFSFRQSTHGRSIYHNAPLGANKTKMAAKQTTYGRYFGGEVELYYRFIFMLNHINVRLA